MHGPVSMETDQSYVGIILWIVYIHNRIVDLGISVMVIDNINIFIGL